MFFLFGLRTKEKSIGQIERTCTKCAKDNHARRGRSAEMVHARFHPRHSAGEQLCGTLRSLWPNCKGLAWTSRTNSRTVTW